ncbi:MAG: hypothetical protein WCK21_09755 [Actinomycetota bacterium]
MRNNVSTLNRSIHLIDLENLCGEPRPSAAVAELAHRAYLAATRPDAGDHFVVAVNHGAALNAGLSWKGARLLLRSGPNGADEALLDVLRYEQVDERFTSIKIASGDGIFAPAAGSLAASGLVVTVVARPGSCSAALKLASHHLVTLDIYAQEAEAA